MQLVKFILHAAITFGGSIAMWFLVGPLTYILVGALVASVSFVLVLTSNARTAKSTNPDVVLQPIPIWSWAIGSFGIAFALGGFWPVLPIALTWNSAFRAARASAVGGVAASKGSARDERP